jgi:hypothetical protein
MDANSRTDPGEPRNWYITTWRKVYDELLGSAEPALSRTIDRWRRFMADENDLFYHETPLSYAMGELIQNEFPHLPDYFNGLQLSRELEEAITPPGEYAERFCPDLDPQLHWAGVRRRVRHVFDRWRHEFS